MENYELENKNYSVEELLLSLGMSPNLQGFHFLKESIYAVMKNPIYCVKTTKLLYPMVADKYNTTSSRVERAMRHALEVSYNKGKIVKMNSIFGLDLFNKYDKPTNTEFVSLVADRLSNI